MTELDVRRKEEPKPNYENLMAIKPPRPPPPSGSKLSVKKFPDNSHLYASVHKGSQKIDISKRPLPPPPVPPRPKYMSSPGSVSVGSQSSTGSQTPTTRDVCVSTKDNGLIQVCEKETQSENHDLNGNIEPDLEPDLDPETPTTPTPTNSISEPVPKARESKQQKTIAEQSGELSESTVTISSLTTSYFDAEEPDNWDEETINDDIESITSNYQSLSSDVTITSSQYASAPDPEYPITEIPIQTPSHKTGLKLKLKKFSTKSHYYFTHNKWKLKMSVVLTGKRSQSITHRPQESSSRTPRRSLPENQLTKVGSQDDDSEDTDELLGLTRDLQSELKQILDRRSKLPQRPDSTNSSNASLHEVCFKNFFYIFLGFCFVRLVFLLNIFVLVEII